MANPKRLYLLKSKERSLTFRLLSILLLSGLCASLASKDAWAHNAVPDPCSGPSGLLAELDRPTVSDSACVAKPGRTILEMGYQHQTLTGAGGRQDNFPEAELRFGLPDNNEFVLLPPNYIRQTTPAIAGGNGTQSGYSATVLGWKHELGYTRHWLYAAEGLFTLPTGTAGFGSPGPGVALNGIVSYSLTPTTGLSLMLGMTSEDDGSGKRYTSVNPDLVGTELLSRDVQLYAELYGQSRTAAGQGSGWDADGGIQYLLTRYWEVDAEIGTRVAGRLGGFDHYLGLGMGVEF